ncbi:MAG: metalloregulator ArsR/SmtB family transcription factor [Leptolyngbyaceae cyanobacterium bins.302]|nr:metalloregulator ArsR/SmtB family transcription factor [Leptolyngbyaceae cyanobacterium bins.302]
MRPFVHPDRQSIALAGVLYALGDPVRLKIVKLLAAKGELSCSGCDDAVREIVAEGIAKSTLSHHFRILREAGVIYTRKEGTTHINSLRQQDLDNLFPGLLEAVLRSPQ